MDRAIDSERKSAERVATSEWLRSGALSDVHLGINRQTWKVEPDLWLTAVDAARADLLEREHRLFRALGDACADARVTIAIPRIVTTSRGLDVVTRDGLAFRATAHLAGARPDDDRAETFTASMRALRLLHPVLRDLPPDLGVLPPMLTEMRALTEHSLSDAWTPVTDDGAELDAVQRIASWLSPRLDRLGDAPAQLVHGDWATPNLLFDRRDGDRVVAALDWQCCSLGPVIADVAQAVAGVLMWSRLPIDSTVDAMSAAYGAGADRRLLAPALAAHWLRNYWWLRAELTGDSRRRAAMERQPARLRAVLDYVTNRSD